MNSEDTFSPLVSVIVPCFNVEWCLSTNMESLLGQAGVSFEVIAVDDGSTDNTRSILKELSNAYANLRIVNQDHKGVSAARNAGLDMSRGHWIAFFDPDDVVQSDWLASMVETCESQHSDGCICAYIEADVSHLDSGKKHDCEFATPLLNRDSILHELLPGLLGRSFADVNRDNGGGDIRDGHVEGMVWRFLFSRQLIEDHRIRFDERVTLAEDELFCAEYALRIQSLASMNEARYIYVRHPRGAINRLISRRDFSHLTIDLLSRRDIGLRIGDEEGLLERFWLASLVLPLFGTMYRCGVLEQPFSLAYKSCRSYCSFPEVKRALQGFPLSAKRFSRSAMVLMMRFGMRPALFTALYCFGRLRGMVS